MQEPSKEIVEQIKKTHSDRALHQVEMSDGDETLYFLMTGPNRIEYKKFQDEVLEGKAARDEKEQVEKIAKAIERAALAQIRWPDRDLVQQMIDAHPAIIANFSDEIHKAAGSTYEVRSKKL